MDVSLSTTLVLVLAAFVAGTIDAIAGGGGLISMPALLSTGWPVPFVLGTNKAQSVWGSLAALFQYRRAGHVRLRLSWQPFVAGFAGAVVGARLVLWIEPKVLRPIVLVLLVCAAVLLTLRPMPKHVLAVDERVRRRRAVLVALTLGVYDGFFGPGMGTFLIIAATYFLGRTAEQATAEAKIVNVASNFAALTVFVWNGLVVWHVALPMAAAQLLAGTLGSRLAVRGGQKVIRPLVLVVVVALVAKLGYDAWSG